MRKTITWVVLAALVVWMVIPATAFATGDGGQSRMQSSYEGGFTEPQGNGDTERLQTQDRLYTEDCAAESEGEQAQTQTQTREWTRTQTQEMVGDSEGAEVKAQVKAGALGEPGDGPEETPVAATVRAEVAERAGFFGGIAEGLQRVALQLMAWLGLL